MSSKKKKDTTEEVFENVEQTLTKTEVFIEENRNTLGIIVVGILVIAGAVWGYQKWIKEPLELEAQQNLFMAEQWFKGDSLDIALNGRGQFMGFLDIIDEYGSTKAGNMARYYAGISYLRQGDFTNAISYLDKFKGKDEILSVIATGAIGDAFLELNQPEEALEYYLKATKINKNDLARPVYLKRAGLVAEDLGDHKKALELFKALKKEHKDSREAADIDRYIAKAETHLALNK